MVVLRLCSAPPTATTAPLLEVVAVRAGDQLWIDVRGEADLATHTTLVTALSRLQPLPDELVHLQLSRLDFCDLGCARVLLDFAERVRRCGGSVATHDGPRVLHRVVALLGSEDALGL